MNDSLRSDVFMRYNPESIACACLYLAARQEKIVLPSNPPWFLMFEVTEDVIQEICLSILRLYARDKVGPYIDWLPRYLLKDVIFHVSGLYDYDIYCLHSLDRT